MMELERTTESGQATLPSGGDAAICTLFEGDYHLGLAAFLNSLVRAGYAGTVWAGYRGALPPWLDQLKRAKSDADEYWIADQVRLVFLKLSTSIHLTNYKPEFMLNLLANEARDCKYLWYFDPDIFVKASWSFFADWQSNGIALCQEIANNILPPDAPLRQSWIRAAASIGFADPKPLYYYHNGGLAGVPREYSEFLEDWKRLIEMAGSRYCDLKNMSHGAPEAPFQCCDQDSLNIAAMYSKFPLSTLGPQGMGFIRGNVIMYHTVGAKPWRGSFLVNTMKGVPPSDGAKFYLDQAQQPIRPYSRGGLAAKRLACGIAAFIGRFYRRG
jgi:hypothetical protein